MSTEASSSPPPPPPPPQPLTSSGLSPLHSPVSPVDQNLASSPLVHTPLDPKDDCRPSSSSQIRPPTELSRRTSSQRVPPVTSNTNARLSSDDDFDRTQAQQRRPLYAGGNAATGGLAGLVGGSVGGAGVDIWGAPPVINSFNYSVSNNDPLRTGRAASDGLVIGKTHFGDDGSGGSGFKEDSDWERAALFRDRERRSLESSANVRLLGQIVGGGGGGGGGNTANFSSSSYPTAVASPPNSATTITSGSSTSYFGSSSLSTSATALSPDSATTTPATSSNRSSGSAPSGDSGAVAADAQSASVGKSGVGDIDDIGKQKQQNQHQHQQLQPQSQQQQGCASLHLGDLDVWMDEAYVRECCARMGWEGATNIKMIRGASPSSGYCFLTFPSAEQAASVLAKFNASPPTLMPRSTRTFKLNWGTGFPGLQPRWEGEYSVFVGDLGREVGEAELVSLFTPLFPSTKSAKIMHDPSTGISRGYGFIRFAEEADLHRALLLGQHSGSGLSLHGRTLRISEASGPSGGGHHHHQQQHHQQQHHHHQQQQQHHHGLQQQQQQYHHLNQNQQIISNPHQLGNLRWDNQYSPYLTPMPSQQSIFGEASKDRTQQTRTGEAHQQQHHHQQQIQEPYHSEDLHTSQHQQQLQHQQPLSHLNPSYRPVPFKRTPLSPSSPLSGFNGSNEFIVGSPSMFNTGYHPSAGQHPSSTPLSPSSLQFHPMTPMLGSAVAGAGVEAYGQDYHHYNHQQHHHNPPHQQQRQQQQHGRRGGAGGGGASAAPHTTDPNNTTVFVGGLPACISEETLKSFFHHFGDITYCKIPTGKGCGFVQFVRRSDAEMAIIKMNDFPIHGKSRIRLSWGRSQGDKQVEHVRKLANALGVPFEAVWRMVQGQDNTTIKQITSAVGGGVVGDGGDSGNGGGGSGPIALPGVDLDNTLRGVNTNRHFESLGIGRMDLGAVASAAGLTEEEVMELVGGRSSSSTVAPSPAATDVGPYSRVSPSTFSAFSSAGDSFPTAATSIMSPLSASLPPLSPPPSAGPFSNHFYTNVPQARFSQTSHQPFFHDPHSQHQSPQQQPFGGFGASIGSHAASKSVRTEPLHAHSPLSPYGEKGDDADQGVTLSPPGNSKQPYGGGGGNGLDESFAHLRLGFNEPSYSSLPSFSAASREFLPLSANSSTLTGDSGNEPAFGTSGSGGGVGSQWGSWQGRPNKYQEDIKA